MAAEFNCDETRPEYQSLGGELKGVTSLVIHATTAQPELGERAARKSLTTQVLPAIL